MDYKKPFIPIKRDERLASAVPPKLAKYCSLNIYRIDKLLFDTAQLITVWLRLSLLATMAFG